MKLFDSELQVMEVLWEKGDLCAREVARILADKIGWNKNTTYTVVKKCVQKGFVERREPGFVCHALLSRQQAQMQQAEELVDKMFSGSPSMLFASLLGGGRLDADEIDKLRHLIDQAK